MKKCLTSLLLFFLGTQLFSQTKTAEQIDADLAKSYKKIVSSRIDADTIAWQSLETENNLFRKKIAQYTSTYPITLTAKFDLLRKENMYIVTSDDHLFRIYSWDTWQGGTMHDFENVFQYKSEEKVYSKLIYESADDSEKDYIPYYSELFTLRANNKTYYLAIANGIYSSKDLGQSIKIFTIENNTISDNARIIKTKSGLTNSISVDFDFFSVVDRPERPLKLIKYDADKKIIYIPIVLENGKVTNRFIRYKFTGQYFEKIVEQKNTVKAK